jgi:hypothetical protein
MMVRSKPAPHERPLFDDTDADARKALVRVYQKMSAERKATRVGELRYMTKRLFEAGYKDRHPEATPDDLIDAWLRHTLDPDSFEKARSYRHELARRRVERSAESSSSAGANEDSLRSRGIAGQLGPRSPEINQ